MIVKTDPNDYANAQFVVAFSDAETNASAIRDINSWARENGLVRSNESFLNVKLDASGNQLFYGACYRLDTEDSRAADSSLASIRSVRGQMPVTAGSETLVEG